MDKKGLSRKRKVLVGGTFEYLHSGHVKLLSEAAKLGQVTVVVSRKGNAERAKGRKVIVPERIRLAQVRSLKLVGNAILGGKNGISGGILAVRPDVIFLGPDQPSKRKMQKILLGLGFANVKILRLGRKILNESSRAWIRRLLS